METVIQLILVPEWRLSVVDLNRVSGVVIGIVCDLEDPDGLGRVKVSYPWLGGEPVSSWCRIASPMAGGEHGFFYSPELESEALVAFEHGDFNRGYIIGYLWSGETPLPTQELEQRLIKSVTEQQILLDDRSGEEGITISDSHGNSITMNKDGIEIKSDKKITINATGELEAVGSPINLNP